MDLTWRGSLVTAVAVLALVPGPGRVRAAAPGAESSTFRVIPESSRVRIHVDRAGILSFAGHRHEIAGPVSGSLTAVASDPAASWVELHFAVAELRVLPEGEPDGDPPKVEAVMLGPRLLDAAHFAEIVFRSRTVSGRSLGAHRYALRVTGELTIHGVGREVTVPVQVELERETLRASASLTIRQTDFGLTPVTAAGGTVRARDEIALDFVITAQRETAVGTATSTGSAAVR